MISTIIFVIIIIILIIIILKILKNSSFVNIDDYMSMTEEDFNLLSIPIRWKHRTAAIKYFQNFKNDYKLTNYTNLPESKKNNLIFINLASYRDPECNNTIKNIILNCNNWKNLRIYVCQQNSDEDIDALYNLPDEYKSIVFVNRISYLDARGPTYARYLIQQNYNSEEYYLQIDSHTLVEKDWDYKLKKSLRKLPDNSCLTQYLPDYEIGQNKTDSKLRGPLNVSRICALDGFTRINAEYIDPHKKYKQPFKSNGWSGCFSFSGGDICKDAPIDPYTPDVFFGEEMDICLRLYTRNWNFYSPNYPIAYTNFDRSYRETFWEKKGKGYNKNITLCSRLRIHYRLGTLPSNIKLPKELLIDCDKFTLGNNRTLSDYEKLIGMKFKLEK